MGRRSGSGRAGSPECFLHLSSRLSSSCSGSAPTSKQVRPSSSALVAQSYCRWSGPRCAGGGRRWGAAFNSGDAVGRVPHYSTHASPKPGNMHGHLGLPTTPASYLVLQHWLRCNDSLHHNVRHLAPQRIKVVTLVPHPVCKRRDGPFAAAAALLCIPAHRVVVAVCTARRKCVPALPGITLAAQPNP